MTEVVGNALLLALNNMLGRGQEVRQQRQQDINRLLTAGFERRPEVPAAPGGIGGFLQEVLAPQPVDVSQYQRIQPEILKEFAGIPGGFLRDPFTGQVQQVAQAPRPTATFTTFVDEQGRTMQRNLLTGEVKKIADAPQAPRKAPLQSIKVGEQAYTFDPNKGTYEIAPIVGERKTEIPALRPVPDYPDLLMDTKDKIVARQTVNKQGKTTLVPFAPLPKPEKVPGAKAEAPEEIWRKALDRMTKTVALLERIDVDNSIIKKESKRKDFMKQLKQSMARDLEILSRTPEGQAQIRQVAQQVKTLAASPDPETAAFAQEAGDIMAEKVEALAGAQDRTVAEFATELDAELIDMIPELPSVGEPVLGRPYGIEQMGSFLP